MKQGTLVPALESVLAVPVEGRSPWQDARMRFARNKAAVASLVILLLITLACAIGPMLLPNAFDSTDWNMMSSTPTFANWHLFGTDDTGRDLLVRCLIGGRVSLMIGGLATLTSVTLGIVWGAIAGTGSVNITLEIVVSIFLLFLTCPSPRSKKVCHPT